MSMNPATATMIIDKTVTDPKPSSWHTPTVNDLRELGHKLIATIEPMGTQGEAIRANRSLSEQGQQAALKQAGTDRVSAYAFLWRKLQALAAARTQLRTELQMDAVPSPVSDKILAYFRAREIRDRLSETSEADRAGVFLRAAETDNTELLAAMLDAPGTPLIDDETKARGLTARAERLKPAQFAALQQNELLTAELDAWRTLVTAMLRNWSVDPKTIADALGGPVGLNGTPDGRPRLEGTAWARAVAEKQAVHA